MDDKELIPTGENDDNHVDEGDSDKLVNEEEEDGYDRKDKSDEGFDEDNKLIID